MENRGFDPNGVGQDNGNYFGLPFTPEESAVVLLSVPWDVTASYGGGAAYGPDAIIGASVQLDLYEPLNPGAWRRGIGTIGIDYGIQEKSVLLREDALKIMRHMEKGGKWSDESVRRRGDRINDASAELNEYVKRNTASWMDRGKVVGLVGGDHSTPYGAIAAAAERYPGLSVLHIDAHADLRCRYEGFEDSHASIMYNVVTRLSGVQRLVQVGVRDFCDAEYEFASGHERITTHYDHLLNEGRFNGVTWADQCASIVEGLSDTVYISFDIDGLSPQFCPHTGTPVPGGLSFDEAVKLLDTVACSGRRIVGFDLCEVAPGKDDEWDANVGARMLYKMCNIALKTTV